MSPLDPPRDRRGPGLAPRRAPPVWQLIAMLVMVILLIWYLNRFN